MRVARTKRWKVYGCILWDFLAVYFTLTKQERQMRDHISFQRKALNLLVEHIYYILEEFTLFKTTIQAYIILWSQMTVLDITCSCPVEAAKFVFTSKILSMYKNRFVHCECMEWSSIPARMPKEESSNDLWYWITDCAKLSESDIGTSSSYFLKPKFEPDIQQSFICLPQIYMDKSWTFLDTNGLTFYPLHPTGLTLLKFWRRSKTLSGHSFFGYVPVSFAKNCFTSFSGPGRFLSTKARIIQAPHLSI